MPTFIECTSLNVSYDITGIATVSYTVISDAAGIIAYDEISVGNRTFIGYVTSATNSIMPKTEAGGPWYQTQVSLLAIAS